MFDTLLESRARRQSSAGGAAASLTAHATLVAGALIATMQIHVQTPKPSDATHVVYFPPRAISVPAPLNVRGKGGRAVLPAPIQPAIPRMILSGVLSDITSVTDPLGPPPLPGIGSAGGSGAVRGTGSNGVFQESEVEKPVALVPGGATPRYPEVLRSSGVEGRVIALFVVDETGRAEADSVRFTRSDNRLFDDAVRGALRRMRFIPAEIGGRKVRQLVQMPFVFTLDR